MEASRPDEKQPVPGIAALPEDVEALGVEIGSVYFKAVGLGPGAAPRFHFKRPHHGDPLRWLKRFEEIAATKGIRLGVSGGPAAPVSGGLLDGLVCLQATVGAHHPEARAILEIGAGHLLLVRLGEGGRIQSVDRNSLCAAGTGSFLDAQAGRMGIDYGQLGRLPTESLPSIATRCAVFAKSDLIYRQQEGFPKDALWSGLCRGLVDGLLQALTRGRPLSGPVVLCGGVALNEAVVWWLRQRLENGCGPAELIVLPRPEFAVALGAGLLADGSGRPAAAVGSPAASGEARQRRPVLQASRSRPPSAPKSRVEVDERGNEAALRYRDGAGWPSGDIDVFLGIDIGSTSTKLVLADEAGRVVLDIYRPTGADPVAAVQELFNAVDSVARRAGCHFRVRGAAATGSGRKLVGPLIGADLVINEISAHVAGAAACDPDVETIFEIGGQDAKYMSVRNGRIVDANMNYVCAAGTGSFIEELAVKLGYRIEEIGPAALGATPPFTSSRCTVFMEQDILNLLQHGVSRREAAAAVMYSVIENYLERVVGRRPVQARRVFFQGATARNPGLAAAIENILGVEVVVSPYCHVMGALGAALSVKAELDGRPTVFRGFDFGKRTIVMQPEDCRLCANRCRLTRAVIQDEPDRPLWGMKCGRDESSAKKKTLDGLSLFRAAAAPVWPKEKDAPEPAGRPSLVLPRALSTRSHFAFWKAVFDDLGIAARLGSADTRRSVELGAAHSGPDFCLPLKAAVGQAADLLRGETGSRVFLPFMLNDEPSPGLSQSRFCPYVETLPSVVRAALGHGGFDLSRLVSPLVDFRRPDEENARNIAAALGPVLEVGWKDVARALSRGREARRRREEALAASGRQTLERLRRAGEAAVVIIGHPYSALDEELNKGVPRTISQAGLEVIPMEGLPWDPSRLQGELRNLFWASGQRMLSAALQVAETDGLYGVYLSHFGCGPDSFLVSYAETFMGDKPFLVLELDDHGSSGGYETRVEAFLDVIRKDRQAKRPHGIRLTLPEEPAADLETRKLWLPDMHPISVRTMAAAFRSEGVETRPLPLEDEKTLALGRRWTRGAECLPMSLTLGAFLNQVEEDRRAGGRPEREAALFLPTSTGPCRFGQYRTLDRIVFERLGLGEVPILSPGAHNAYFGLPRRLRSKVWRAIVGGDALFKMGCRVRPYETQRGDTAETLDKWTAKSEALVESNRMSWPAFLEEAMRDFLRVPVSPERRPLVGIVGEIYVRCNTFASGRLVEAVEKAGGEAWLSPVAEWILYSAWIERYLARANWGEPWRKLGLAAKWRYLSGQEHSLYERLSPLLGDRLEPPMGELIRSGRRLLPPEFPGESITTLGRAFLFGRNGADLVVNCAPFGCMHGNITSAIFDERREEMAAPVVSIFYDGAEDNSVLNGFIQEALRKKR